MILRKGEGRMRVCSQLRPNKICFIFLKALSKQRAGRPAHKEQAAVPCVPLPDLPLSPLPPRAPTAAASRRLPRGDQPMLPTARTAATPGGSLAASSMDAPTAWEASALQHPPHHSPPCPFFQLPPFPTVSAVPPTDTPSGF